MAKKTTRTFKDWIPELWTGFVSHRHPWDTEWIKDFEHFQQTNEGLKKLMIYVLIDGINNSGTKNFTAKHLFQKVNIYITLA